MAHDVFISYASSDQKVAEAICSALERHDVKCWIAPRDIRLGMEYGEAIITGITGSRVMVLVVSRHTNESKYVRLEVERAVDKDVIVIPFRVEDVQLSKALEFFTAARHHVDAITPPLEDHVQVLAEKLRQLLGMPRDEPHPPTPRPPVDRPPVREPPAPPPPPPPPPPARVPFNLGQAVRDSGLKTLEVQPGVFGVPFKGDRADRVIVEIHTIGEDIVFFGTLLPETGSGDREATLHHLLRCSFSANYVKTTTTKESFGLAVELPQSVVTPTVVDGIVRGLVFLADVTKKDVLDESGWKKRIAMCGAAQETRITVDAALGQRLLSEQAKADGTDLTEQPGGIWLLQPDVGGQKLKVVVRFMRQVVSCIAFMGDTRPSGDRKAYMTHLLDFNRMANVAKVGLDKDDDVALLFEVPQVYPGLVTDLRKQFTALLLGLAALSMGH